MVAICASLCARRAASSPTAAAVCRAPDPPTNGTWVPAICIV